MSNTNGKQPLQLIRFHEGKFEVPEETQLFLSSFSRPLALVSVVGKYRTGKSLFLNKVLLQQPSFTVSPTINSCTKGLWLSRQTLSTEQAELLVIDTEGFGAPEETDQYNQKILLFAMLLSSYFIYNSVGAIDENSLNSLNLVSQIARQILKQNSRDDKAEEEAPAFLWLLRDFALNLVDKNGTSIQARDYLQQSLEPQKGSSDAIEGKNKIRRMLKHFFKDRDCFTLVRPVQSEEHLQNLLFLPDSAFRNEFMEQSALLRSKIMKKIRPKRIKGRPLDGPLLLQLIHSYVQVVNRGELPNFQLSYKRILKVQAVKEAQQYVDSCKTQLLSLSGKLLSTAALEELQNQMNKELEGRFKQLGSQSEMKAVTEQTRKEILHMIKQFAIQNQQRCSQRCQSAWQDIYEPQEWSNSAEVQSYFRQALERLKEELSIQNNPIPPVQVTSMVLKHQVGVMSCFCAQTTARLQGQISSRECKIQELQEANASRGRQLSELQQVHHGLTRELSRMGSKLSQTENVKNMEITYLKQNQADQNRQISQLSDKLQEVSAQLEEIRQQSRDYQQTQQQLARETRQLQEENRLLAKELTILKSTLANREEQNSQLKYDLSETSTRLETSLQREAELLNKHQLQLQQKQTQHLTLLHQHESTKEQLNLVKNEKQQLEQSLSNNSQTLERESNIYEQMFESLRDSLRSESSSRQELIETNQNLSAALKHLELRTQQAEEKEKILKDYKKAVKNSSCLQCAHCSKFFVPTIFLPHLAHCLLAPSPKSLPEEPSLNIRIRQTLIKDSDGKPFTEYVVELTRNGKQWTLHRKYKSFCDLHAALKGALPGVELSEVSYIVNPQQASKKSMQIEERRKVLQKYMQDLENNPFVRGSSIWMQFLQEPEESRRSSPLRQRGSFNINQSGGKEPTPEEFFKVWNERKLRGKQSQSFKNQWKIGLN